MGGIGYSLTFSAIGSSRVLVRAKGKSADGKPSQHWATVIGKQDGKYTIIDPYTGTQCPFEQMEIYKNGGASVLDYVILTNEY